MERIRVLCGEKIFVLPWNAQYSDGSLPKVKPYWKYPKVKSAKALQLVEWTDEQRAQFAKGETLIVTYVRKLRNRQRSNSNRYTVE